MDVACSDGLPSDFLTQALARGQFGCALLDESQRVTRRDGALSAWLPEEGAPACISPLLLNMEDSVEGLKVRDGNICLPSVRLPGDGDGRVTITINWDNASKHYLVMTIPDHGANQIERLLASERREKQVVQQQAAAAAAETRTAEQRYIDVVESSGVLVFRYAPDFRVTFANGEAARFLGKPKNALIGERMADLFPTTELTPWRVELAGDRPVEWEMQAPGANGEATWLAFETRFLGSASGGETQAVARDVTPLRRLRVERQKAREEEQDAAIANERLLIAHDLHDTLVRSIVTLIAQMRLVARKTVDPEAKAMLAQMDGEAREGLQETREAIMRLRAGALENRQRVDLRAIVSEFGGRAGAPKIETQFSEELPELTGEIERLFAAVLKEALRNIELHAGARNVRVALSRDAQSARLEIEDDGVGFHPTLPTPGHFGVAGMRERARLSGATLGLSSAPGHGARITLVAPLALRQ